MSVEATMTITSCPSIAVSGWRLLWCHIWQVANPQYEHNDLPASCDCRTRCLYTALSSSGLMLDDASIQCVDLCIWCLVSDIQHSLGRKDDAKPASSAQVSAPHSLRFHTPTFGRAEPCQTLKPPMKEFRCCMQAFAAMQAHKSLTGCLPAQF